MERFSHAFKNRGTEVYNDDVFERTFSLDQNDYSFVLNPTIDTQGWRFGIVLSKTESFDFSPNNGRYNNSELRFVQINVGDRDGKEWKHIDKIELQTYYFAEFQKPLETYHATDKIEWIKVETRIDHIKKQLFIYVLTAKSEFKSIPINLNDYRFFRLSAWSDETPFFIQCDGVMNVHQDFKFPFFSLDREQKRYLEIIYSRFLSNTPIESAYSLSEIWKEFASDFNPGQINQLLLIGDREITLWGIWHIDSSSPLFEKFDRIILTIKSILSGGGSVREITSSQIHEEYPELSIREIGQVFKLMSNFGGFSNGSGSASDGILIHINISENRVFEQYRTYSSLQIFMNDYLQKHGIILERTDQSSQLQESSIEKSERLSQTPLYRSPRENFRTVLGINDLAADLAAIINQLPDEKGQMVGIFGRWGRGKTTLLNELWTSINKQDAIKYTRVEYHAWKYQETPASWAYLYEILADSYLGRRNWGNLRKYWTRLWKLNWKRVGIWPILKMVLGMFFTFSGLFIAHHWKGWIAVIIAAPFFVTALVTYGKKLYDQYSTKAFELIKKFTIRHTYKQSLGMQAEIQGELIKLLQVWIPDEKKPKEKKAQDGKADKDNTKHKRKKRKILLVVEDLDRCSEDRIIQVIDSLRVMLEDDEIARRLIIVTAIDERILKSAIRTKYESLPKESKNRVPSKNENSEDEFNEAVDINELISEYIDKLFIMAIKLGDLGDEDREKYMHEVLRRQSATFEENTGLRTVSNIPLQSGKIVAESVTEISEATEISSGEIITEVQEGYPVTENGEISKTSSTEVRYFTDFEQKCIVEIIKRWVGVSPRRANIFFFRYLLFKNLLIQKYNSKKQEITWFESEEGIRRLFRILKYYSDQYNPEMICLEKKRIIGLPEGRASIIIEKKAEAFPVLKRDCLYVLDILELVIAY